MQTSARFPDDDPQKQEQDDTPPGDDLPDPSWSLERLASYAKDEVTRSFHAEHEAILQAHKSAVHLFRAGHALALARSKCKGEQHGEWKKFKKNHGLADTTANDAIRLFESAKTQDALVGLGITEAKVKFGIAGPKKKSSPDPKRAPKAGPAHRPGDAEEQADKSDNQTAVAKESAGSGFAETDEGETSSKTDDTQEQAAARIGSADEQAITLVEELKEIAQRLSEINQDTFGKIHWNRATIRKAKNALAALNNHAIAIHRRLRNEE